MPTNKEIVDELLTTDKDQISDAYGQPQAHIALEDQISDKAPLKEEDFIEEGQTDSNSIFKVASEEIDIDKDISNYFNNLKNTNIWNESVKSAIDNFVDRFLGSNSIIPTTDGNNFNINDIRKANAGKSFSNEPWVRPDNNIDGDSYEGVRGNDAIQSVLKNVKELQFTRTQNQTTAESEENSKNKYIRLLMPKNTRRVEVEDLDRNFWVIGQTLAGISSFLFDTKSPLIGTLQSLLSEVHQLWENVLYLWVDLWAETNLVTKVHSEVIYLPSKKSFPEMKFDNYGDSTPSVNEIENRLSYLIDKYPKCNLCIIPITRYNNYFKNYYRVERYQGIWFYDYNIQKWIKKGFQAINNDSKWYFNFSSVAALSGDVLLVTPDKDKVFGLKVKENSFEYQYVYPLSQAEEVSYIGGIRTKPVLTCNYDVETKTFSGTFTITMVDYAAESAVYTNTTEMSKIRTEKCSWSFTKEKDAEEINITKSIFTTNSKQYTEGMSGTLDIKKGFYLGELPSILKNTIVPVEYEMDIEEINLYPIVESLPIIVRPDAVPDPSDPSKSSYMEALQAYSINTLNYVISQKPTSNKIKLYTGTYRNNIFGEAGNKGKLIENIWAPNCAPTTIGTPGSNYKAFYLNNSTSIGNLTPINLSGNTLKYQHNGYKYLEEKEVSQFWNRSREIVRLGCIIVVPGHENTSIESYQYWAPHIAHDNSNDSTKPYSLAPLYIEEDQTITGRRGKYYYFYTFYKKPNVEWTRQDSWAIKLTEVYMDWAPAINGGQKPAYNRSNRNAEISGQNSREEIWTQQFGGCGKVSSNTPNSIYTVKNGETIGSGHIIQEFAPLWITGTTGDPNNSWKYTTKSQYSYYFFPMTTRIVTHIFQPTLSTLNVYSDNIWYRIDAFGEWLNNGSFISKKGGSYDTLNQNLNNYEIVGRGSNFNSTERARIKNIFTNLKNKGLGDDLPGEFEEGNYWLDFERWPSRGFGPSTTGDWSSKIIIY